MHNFLLATGFGLVTASIIAISAVALSLQYSVTSVPNFAHGEVMMVGAYSAWVVSKHSASIPLEILVSIFFGAIVSWSINRFVLQPFLHRKAKNLVLFVLTIACSLILQNLVLLFFGGAPRAMVMSVGGVHHVGPFRFTGMGEFTIATAVVVCLLVHVVLKYTFFGKAQRAVADHRELARVSGIHADRTVGLTWLFAGGITGLSGFILAITIGSLTPTTGSAYLLVIFAAAVVGGIGQAYGAIIGSLVIGLTMEWSALYLPSDYKIFIAFGILITMLIVRPGGIITTRLRNVAE
jgi:branched-subunit amino acid ABC-type transport system permease component